MRRFVVFIFVALNIMASADAGQDLMDAFRAGLNNDPRFKVAQHQYEAAREAVPQAYAALLPVVTLEGQQGKQKQEILQRENTFFGVGRSDFTTSSFEFQASQPIYRHDTWVRLAQSKAFVRQSYSTFLAAEQDLILRTAEAYLRVLASKDNVEFTQAEQVAVSSQLELVEARRRGGLATITDEYEARARAAKVEADVISTEYALDDAYQALREIVGDAVTDVVELKKDIPLKTPDPDNVEAWIDRALKQNYNLMARNDAVVVAEHEVDRRRSGHLPSLDLVARHGNNETGGAVTGGGSDTNTTEVSLQVSVPIFSGGAVRSQTREANQLYRRSLEERNLQHRVTMRETRAAFQGVRSAISRVSALSDALLSQESVLSGRTKGYRSGVNTVLDVLDAERDLTSSRRDYARARYEYLLNMLRLKQQVGALGESDLWYVNSLLQTTRNREVEQATTSVIE